MATVSRSTKISGGTTLSSNTLARAADVETDMLTLFNAHNNHDSGTSKWTVVSALNSSATPLIADNSSGTNNIAEFKDNSSAILTVADGGVVTFAPGGTTKAVVNSSGITLSNSATIAMGSAKVTGLANGTAATDAAAFGQLKIIQYQSGTSTTNFSTSSSTFQTTNLSVSITPTATTSKILVLAAACGKLSGSGAITFFATIARGGSNLMGSAGQSSFSTNSSVGAMVIPISMVYLDSPSSTSSLTYAVQVRNSDGATSIEFPGSANTTQSIVAIELA